MSLINDASLIITPNAVKEGKLYSIIPSKGNGDMTVVRATTATRVNELGLIENTPYNLFNNSEDFSIASWNKFNVSVALNQGIAPNKTNTVNKITVDNTSNTHSVRQGIQSQPGTKTLSFFVNKTTNRYVACSLIYNLNSRGVGIIVDTLTETIVSSSVQSSIFTVNYVTIENFLRISLTVANIVEDIINSAYISPYNNEQYTWQIDSLLPSYTGDGISSLFVWGAQLVQGSEPKDYFFTTNRLNVARLNYDSVGGCPSILVEPQRTNLVTNSNNVNNTSFHQIDGTYTLDSSVLSPANTNDVYKFTPTTLNASILNASSPPLNRFWIQISITNTTFTNSVYLKSVDGSSFNLNIKVVNFASDTEIKSKTINVTNNWQRVSVTGLTTSNTGVRFVIKSEQAVYLWGFQIEQGLYATSYIPTVASTVTRIADVISKTEISGLIGQTEGTLFSDFNYSGNADEGIQIYPLYIGQGTTADSITIGIYEDKLLCRVFVNNVPQNNFISSILSIGRHKVAFSYSDNNLRLFLNGVLIATDTSALIPTCNQVYVGSSGTTVSPQLININVNMLFKTQLSDQECITLTTL